MRTSVVLAVLVVSGAVAAAASGAVGQPGERDDGSYAAPGTPLARQPGTSGKTLGGTRSQQPRGPGRVGANLLPPPATPRPGNPGNPGTGPIIILPQQPVIVLPGHDHHDDRDVVVVRPPGLTIDGSYRDDRFRLGFHLGSGFPSSIYRRHDGRHLLPYTHSYRGYDYQPLPTMYVLGTYSPVDPFSVGAAMSGGVPQVAPGSSPAQPAAPAELTTLQQAQLHLASGYAQNAVTLLREHLKASAEDYAALRLLGLALLDTGDTEEGV
ncbi:MAG TPA: hypothetical protein VD963_01210, partial [Phycisphaerales bacterium]|nr:hypothetical protein [Phycisphaerales bacterium]